MVDLSGACQDCPLRLLENEDVVARANGHVEPCFANGLFGIAQEYVLIKGYIARIKEDPIRKSDVQRLQERLEILKSELEASITFASQPDEASPEL